MIQTISKYISNLADADFKIQN